MISLAEFAHRTIPGPFASYLHTCSLKSCGRTVIAPGRLSAARGSVTLNNAFHCSAACLETAFAQQFATRPPMEHSQHRHRMPLGLFLLSQEKITASQLQDALEYQRAHPSMKIGQCLNEVTRLSEDIVAQAVASQWGCPSFAPSNFRTLPEIRLPHQILRAHEAIPAHWDPRARRLLLGFLSRIDYVAMSAISTVLRCTVNPCILRERNFLQAVRAIESSNSQDEAVFPQSPDTRAPARIIRNYVEETSTEEVWAAQTSRYLWARLRKPKVVDLLFVSPAYAGTGTEL